MTNKKKSKSQKNFHSKSKTSNLFRISNGRVERLYQIDPMGASWRSYPRSTLRKSVIDRLKNKQESEMTGDDWWQLGEYQVIEGLSSGDEGAINAATQALMKGAHLPSPHAGCLLDLGWLLCYKSLDQMALFYLDQASVEVPDSRDVWSLRGWACIGTGNRDQAIISFEKAANLPEATDEDRNILANLRDNADLEKLRKDLVFRKFDDEVLKGKNGDPKDAARSGVIQLKQLLEKKPSDLDLAYMLAYCHYVLNQLDQAEPLLLRVIGEKPDHADALALLGLISKKRLRPDQQKEYYERAVRAEPNHVLANTNLASLHQENGDYHVAKPFLLRAIEAAQPDDIYLPIALDLLGSSYGVIEYDFLKEADLHRQAIALDSKRPIFHANLVIALLSAGRAKDAHRALQAAKNSQLALPNQVLLENLVNLYQDRTLHPYEYMQIVDRLSSRMGWPALKPLVKNAWERRNIVDPTERVDFINNIGMMASKTGDHELALEVWRYGVTLPEGEPFGLNLAVELSNLGRHSEALEAAEKMSMNISRSWTILGNIRLSARQYKLALEAYQTALVKDERFLLPISNAINAARLGLLGDELDPFIDRLKTEWQSSQKAASLLGQALVLQGKLLSASSCFQKALWNESVIRSPEEVWSNEHVAEDLSLLEEANADDHYMAAKCFLEIGKYDLLQKLINQVNTWPKWMNGDWKVLQAELSLAIGELENAAIIVQEIAEQPPSLFVTAKIAILKGEAEKADHLIDIGMRDEKASYFNHPEGSPDALFRTLAAERAASICNFELSEDLARDAIRLDPKCVRARIALVTALEGRVSEEEIRRQIEDGLRRSPGHPILLTLLITSYINSEDPESAANVLEKYRPLLIERASDDVAHRLGEAIAIDRLSRIAPLKESNPVLHWSWLESMQPPLRDWMRGANLSLNRGQELASAYALYVSKVAEFLLITKIMEPFRDSMPDAHTLTSDRHRDVARFMDGGAPPSIGGIARLMDAASRTYRSSDDELTVRFRDAISRGSFGDARILRSYELVDALIDLGRARNSAAHLGEHDISALQAATKCIVSEGQPGLLLRVLKLV